MDEVLLEFLPGFIKFHNHNYDTNFVMKDFNSYNFHEVLGITLEDGINRVYEYHDSRFFDEIEPIPGAQESVKELVQQGHELSIITARNKYFTDKTYISIDKHFPELFSDLYITNHFDSRRLGVTEKSKGEICDLLGSKVMVDDSQHNARNCLKEGRRIYLFDRDYGWNKELDLPPKIEVVSSWHDLMNKLRK